MKIRNSIPLLLLLLLLVCSGLLLLPCYASQPSSINDTDQAHRHLPVKALHPEADHQVVEGGERLKETVRKGGKGAAGKGAYGGADVLRQPNQRRSGGDSVMLRSISSLFLSAGGMMMIMMLLFLGFS